MGEHVIQDIIGQSPKKFRPGQTGTVGIVKGQAVFHRCRD